MDLGQMRWPEVHDGLTVLVPIGSCEQHGPHLPLDTDSQIARAIANGAATGRGTVVVTPTVTFGASGEHAGFPGTLSIGTEALVVVLVELARSADWAEAVVFVNGHGGNLDALRRAVAVCVADGRRVSAWWPSIPNGDAHAGRTETSLLLALGADVREDLAEVGTLEPLAKLLPRLRAGGVRSASANGILGDPTKATRNEGRSLFDRLVRSLGEHIDGLGRMAGT